MTAAEIKTFFEGLIEDSLDATLTYQLMNEAKDLIEGSGDLEIFKDIDISMTAGSSDTYLTPHNLPADFLSPQSSGELYLGDDVIPYLLIPFDKRDRYKNVSNRWYIDFKESKFYLTGSVSEAKTIKLPYLVKTTDWTTSNADTLSPVIPRWHHIYAYKMVELYHAIDMTEPGRSPARTFNKEFNLLWGAICVWDAKLKVAQQAGLTKTTDLSKYPNVIVDD